MKKIITTTETTTTATTVTAETRAFYTALDAVVTAAAKAVSMGNADRIEDGDGDIITLHGEGRVIIAEEGEGIEVRFTHPTFTSRNPSMLDKFHVMEQSNIFRPLANFSSFAKLEGKEIVFKVGGEYNEFLLEAEKEKQIVAAPTAEKSAETKPADVTEISGVGKGWDDNFPRLEEIVASYDVKDSAISTRFPAYVAYFAGKQKTAVTSLTAIQKKFLYLCVDVDPELFGATLAKVQETALECNHSADKMEVFLFLLEMSDYIKALKALKIKEAFSGAETTEEKGKCFLSCWGQVPALKTKWNKEKDGIISGTVTSKNYIVSLGDVTTPPEGYNKMLDAIDARIEALNTAAFSGAENVPDAGLSTRELKKESEAFYKAYGFNRVLYMSAFKVITALCTQTPTATANDIQVKLKKNAGLFLTKALVFHVLDKEHGFERFKSESLQ